MFSEQNIEFRVRDYLTHRAIETVHLDVKNKDMEGLEELFRCIPIHSLMCYLGEDVIDIPVVTQKKSKKGKKK